MKTIFKKTFLVVTLGLTIIGCKNNEDISTDGIISGIIADYMAGSVDSILCFSPKEDNAIGMCSVASNGEFSIILAATPQGSQLSSEYGGSVVVSDPTATGANVSMYAYKNKTLIGYITKCNYTLDKTTVNVGDAVTLLLYVNKTCKITGTQHDTSSYTIVYDLNLVKGWNEVVSKVTAYSSTSTTMTLSTTIPSGLKWQLISIASQVKQFKIPGIKF